MTDGPRLDPARTALLVMDYQAGVLQRLPEPDALLDRIRAVESDVRERGGQVAWVRVGLDDAELAAIPPSSTMARMVTPERRAAMHADGPHTQIHPSLQPQPGDVVVRKTRVGAFTTTDLDARLRERGVTALVLAGVSTSGVVLSTVREAMDRDYTIVVLADASADPDPASHAFLTGTIFPRHATVVTTRELAGLWA